MQEGNDMFTTKNDLSENIRNQSEAMLQIFLADAIDLQLRIKQAHWNIRGPRFIAIHQLFDSVYSDVVSTVDLVAERITQLGGVAEGTVGMVSKNTSLAEFPANATDERDLLVLLTDSIACVAKLGRRGIDQAAGWGDAVTADILTEAVRTLDKDLWMVESHITPRDRDEVKRARSEAGDLEYMEAEGWRTKETARQPKSNY